MPGVSIDNYQRVDTSNLSKVYLYSVRNLWYNTTLSWTFSDPSISNATVLGNNQTLLLFIAGNYSQGDKTPTLNASILTATASITDHFISKPLALTGLLTLTDGPNAISELAIQNNLGAPQNVTWQFNTGQQNFTNTTTVNNSLLVYVQNNYSTTGVYRTTANISNTNYADTRNGVIIQ